MKKLETGIYFGFGESREYPGKAVEFGSVILGLDGIEREFYSEVLIGEDFDEFDESRTNQIQQDIKSEMAEYFGMNESDINLAF